MCTGFMPSLFMLICWMLHFSVTISATLRISLEIGTGLMIVRLVPFSPSTHRLTDTLNACLHCTNIHAPVYIICCAHKCVAFQEYIFMHIMVVHTVVITMTIFIIWLHCCQHTPCLAIYCGFSSKCTYLYLKEFMVNV